MTMQIAPLIRISVRPEYLDAQSQPKDRHYVFAYHITIENHSEVAVRLLTRHWVIVDGDGQREDVRGPGVIGETPTIAPGKQFSYSSGSHFATPIGTMQGSFQMISEDGFAFRANIEPFLLAVPGIVN